MVVLACKPSTGEPEAGEWQIQGQPVLHSEIMPKKRKKQKACWPHALHALAVSCEAVPGGMTPLSSTEPEDPV